MLEKEKEKEKVRKGKRKREREREGERARKRGREGGREASCEVENRGDLVVGTEDPREDRTAERRETEPRALCMILHIDGE